MRGREHTSHGDEHERELLALWETSCGIVTAEVGPRLARCPGCAEGWAQLEAAQARVARTLSAQRADEAAAAVGELAPGEANIERMLVRALTNERSRARVWPQWLAAALALIAIGIGLQRAFAPDPISHDPDLGAALRLRAPLDPSDPREQFVFEAADDGGWFELVITDLDGREILRSKRLERSPWTPTVQERELLPAGFEWRVSAFDASGALEAQAKARVGP